MWSSAPATQSTGTMLVRPRSRPTRGTHPGAVYPSGHVRLLAHDPLGLVLGSVVGRRELLALVEEVLLEQPPVLAGHCDRGDVVQVLDLERPRELDRVRRTANVDGRVEFRRRG